jgi:hypothetical protein
VPTLSLSHRIGIAGLPCDADPMAESAPRQAQSQPCDADPMAESAPRHRVGICPYAHKMHSLVEREKFK